ncbi:FHA domain-containing protein [Permianibacter sp. IMCC34836]|uniref:FHA domain-containing protein n=1 Tax=Permianibacter fluminis TaxID=2738515 RepID=UPI001551C1F9|nr:FHA domain-containing protein [Permianibacter fluminis]NQD36033.1 FHA domain-containing protein [Permianibacter fluminis]
MATTLILEIVSRGRGQPQYRRVRHLPYRIGRGYDNDLILADDTVSADHLQLEQGTDGGIRARNLSHENGSRLGHRKLGFVPEDLSLPATLQLGHTQIRVLKPDTVVAPARRPQAVPGSLALVERLPFALALLALLFLNEVLMAVTHQVEPLTLRAVLLNQAPEMLAPLMTAVLTGFISRLLLHRWQFGLQLTIACVGFIAGQLAIELLQRVSYFYSSNEAAAVLNLMLGATVFTALFAWQLRAFSNLTRERSIVTAIAIAWPLLALFWVQGIVRTPDFRAQPALHLQLQAQDVRQDDTLSLPGFLETVSTELSDANQMDVSNNGK